MRTLPETEDTLLIRTNFTDDEVWETVCSQARTMDPDVREALQFSDERNRAAGRSTGRPIEELGTPLHIIDDKNYSEASCEQVLSLLQPGSAQGFLFIADEFCMEHPDHPLLVVDLSHERGRSFRALPSQTFSIQANLSLANMDWEEFADNVDEDKVFRGFK
jgi:hypothetical protein